MTRRRRPMTKGLAESRVGMKERNEVGVFGHCAINRKIVWHVVNQKDWSLVSTLALTVRLALISSIVCYSFNSLIQSMI